LPAAYVATCTGWALCRVGSRDPACGSIRFASKGASRPAIFAACEKWIEGFLKDRHPDIVAIEAALPVDAIAKSRGGWSRAMARAPNALLSGLIAIAEAEAYSAGIYKINEYQVAMIRGHFIGTNAFPRDQAKFYTQRKCRALGWTPSDDNAADALALWDYQCSLIDPTHGISNTPLFRGVVHG
jgi:hypothetical protein